VVDEVQRAREQLQDLKTQMAQGGRVSEEAFGQALQAVSQAEQRSSLELSLNEEQFKYLRQTAQAHYAEMAMADAAGDDLHYARAEHRYSEALTDLDNALGVEGLVRGEDLDAEQWYQPEHDLNEEDIAVAKRAAQAHYDLMNVPSDSEEFINALDRWEEASQACRKHYIADEQVRYFERTIGVDLRR
jgi:hypothetical protein